MNQLLLSSLSFLSALSPQGGYRPLRGTDKQLRARKGAFFDPRMVSSAMGILGSSLIKEVNPMSVVNPAIRRQFNSMPPHLQDAVLSMGVRLDTMTDLMSCLERIIAEGERHA